MSNFKWNPQVEARAFALAGKGLQTATIFLADAIKETISVPAPRVTLTDKTGARYYVAGFKLNDPRRYVTPYVKGARQATLTSYRFPRKPKGASGAPSGPPKPFGVTFQTAPAIKGDPPRKLSGKLRREVQYEMLHPMVTGSGVTMTTGRVGQNTQYAARLEFGGGLHEYYRRTLNKFRTAIERIMQKT